VAVQAAVRSPTNGSSTPARRAKATRPPAGSPQWYPLGTCMLTMTRVVTSPPPVTAEERARSGASLLTHTASELTSTVTPGIIRYLPPPPTRSPPTRGEGVRLVKRCAEAGQDLGTEGGEACRLLVVLVEQVRHP